MDHITRTNPGSAMDTLSCMKPGDILYVKTAGPSTYHQTMRQYNPPRTRRPHWMKDWVFNTKLFTAVPAGKIEEGVRYLVAVERTK